MSSNHNRLMITHKRPRHLKYSHNILKYSQIFSISPHENIHDAINPIPSDLCVSREEEGHLIGPLEITP